MSKPTTTTFGLVYDTVAAMANHKRMAFYYGERYDLNQQAVDGEETGNYFVWLGPVMTTRRYDKNGMAQEESHSFLLAVGMMPNASIFSPEMDMDARDFEAYVWQQLRIQFEVGLYELNCRVGLVLQSVGLTEEREVTGELAGMVIADITMLTESL